MVGLVWKRAASLQACPEELQHWPQPVTVLPKEGESLEVGECGQQGPGAQGPGSHVLGTCDMPGSVLGPEERGQ